MDLIEYDLTRRAQDFDPVAHHNRFDGLTPERQLLFINALAEGGSVTQAKRILKTRLETLPSEGEVGEDFTPA
jgi:hypothetical protein